MSKRYIVYKHTTPSGKSYIGITTKSIRERIYGGYKHNLFMRRAIEKYGWENITTEILADSATPEEASLLEAYYIESLETKDHTKGYNIEDGGVKRSSYSEETRKKISEAAKKRHRPCTPETREATRVTGINNRKISAVCHGRKKHAGGYRWEFIDGKLNDVD